MTEQDKIAILKESLEYALAYFRAEWAESDNHPGSHFADYVITLQETLEAIKDND